MLNIMTEKNLKKTIRKTAYRIVIEKLVLQASIGIYPHERKKKQPLVISLIISLKLDLKPEATAEINATTSQSQGSLEKQKFICYRELCNELQEIVGRGHIPLLEDLGDMIAQACFARKQAQSLWLSLQKTQASQGAEGVGIELSWQRV